MDKSHILEEIKRTALSNGGVPLGMSRFFQETGIKKYDWYGKFWVRWSDAVKEAGLIPNQLQTAYDEQELIEKFIALTRELGSFPIAPELRLKAHHDKNFPNLKTFSARFGSKREMASKIVEYCKQHEGYKDVIALCEPILENQPLPKEEASVSSEEEVGFVYLIKAGRHYKVGRSNAVGRREYELAIQLPEKSNTIHTIRTDDPIGIEAYWHKRFEAKRKNGEWFELTNADVNAFKRRKFM